MATCYVYKITNHITQEYYLGIHCTNKLHDTYFGSGFELKRNILAYGRKNFSKEIIQYFDCWEAASELEHELIQACREDHLCINLGLKRYVLRWDSRCK